jgi:hypothetical protein
MKHLPVTLPAFLIVILARSAFVQADDALSLEKTQDFIVERIKTISVHTKVAFVTSEQPTEWSEAQFKNGKMILTAYQRTDKRGKLETNVVVRRCDMVNLTTANRFGLACIFIDAKKHAVSGVEHWVEADGTRTRETPIAPGDSLWFWINDKDQADLLVKAINHLIELAKKSEPSK